MTEIATSPGHVCLAVYKPNPELLRIQIESLKSQTMLNWRCLVGIDGTDPEVERLVADLTRDDVRFTVVPFTERVGFYRNFERILKLVPEDVSWVALSDQDDDWKPEKLALLIPFLQENSLVQGQARVRRHGNAASQSEPVIITNRRSVGLAAMMIDNQVTGSLALFRGALLRQALPFPPSTDLAFHDHWLAICATLEGGITVLPNVVQDYVQHDANVIGEISDERLGSRLSRLRGASNGSLMGQLDYLSRHRWGWRVNMAKTAMLGQAPLTGPQELQLKLYAQNRFSLGLLGAHVVACLSRQAPTARSLALLLGSLRAPRIHSPNRRD